MDLRDNRLPLIGLGLLLLSLLLMLGYAIWGPKERSLPDKLSEDFAPLPIPEEALFLPAEPDVIPRTILSREPRRAWSAADAEAFWTDPATLNQGPLKTAAEKEMDGLYASVP